MSEQERQKKKPARTLYIGDSSEDESTSKFNMTIQDDDGALKNPLKDAMMDQKRRVVRTLHVGTAEARESRSPGPSTSSAVERRRVSRVSSPAVMDGVDAANNGGSDLFLSESDLLTKRRQVVSDSVYSNTTDKAQ
jgi:hypothetical protein